MSGCAVALELDDHAHAGAVRFVAQVADAVELAVLDQLGDALQQERLVDLIRELGDDDLEAIAARRFLDERLGANDHPATTGGVGRANAFGAENRAAGRKVGARNELHQVIDRSFRIVDEVGDRVTKLAEVVRRNVGCHANGDAGRAIEQKVRQPAREHGWLRSSTRRSSE